MPFFQEQDWRFCVCGNIVPQHTDQDGHIFFGTKTFSGGTKVYIDGKYTHAINVTDEFCVIGQNRFGKYAIERVPVCLIENVRPQRVFNPEVLSIIDQVKCFDNWDWWGHTATDRKETKEFVRLWKSAFNKISEE